MLEIKLTLEQGLGLSEHISNHLGNCVETIGSDDNMFITEGGEVFEPYGKFCGCSTCIVREQIMATFAYLKNIGAVNIIVSDES